VTSLRSEYGHYRASFCKFEHQEEFHCQKQLCDAIFMGSSSSSGGGMKMDLRGMRNTGAPPVRGICSFTY
jgi:hypothetical protein